MHKAKLYAQICCELCGMLQRSNKYVEQSSKFSSKAALCLLLKLNFDSKRILSNFWSKISSHESV